MPRVRIDVDEAELDASFERARAIATPIIRAVYIAAAFGAVVAAGAKSAKKWRLDVGKGRRR